MPRDGRLIEMGQAAQGVEMKAKNKAKFFRDSVQGAGNERPA